MSSYLVLARKYRPQNFSELVGQEVLVRTITNAIKNNRLHHAYILHGIRGVGKTTTARIIAKTLNCLDESKRNIGEACGECKNCRAITNSHHQDVFEIDAASKTGIDGVRDIIDSIAYSPVEARYKIYIIDEFHMMSDSAFNAFLKTIEEPPANVKFIFATTEIREVPQTILSRCQRFDLRRLDESEIFLHLKNILQKEGLEADEQSLNLIAKASEGSVRDALSILDQALANNEDDKFLSYKVIEKMFGLTDRFKVIELLKNLLKGDFVLAQQVLQQIYQNSSDLAQIANDLLELIHKISSIKLVKNYEIDAYSKLQAKELNEIADSVDIPSLIRVWQIIIKTLPDLKSSNSSRIIFEMLMIRICHLVAIPDLKQVLVDLYNNKNQITKNNFLQNELSSTQKNPESIPNIINEDVNNNPDIISQILRSFEGAKLL